MSSFRKQARRLLAATQEVRLREEKKLLDSLRRKGLAAESATLDDILSLNIEDVLGRRLQTLVFKKGLAISPLHARQLIVHGHVAVKGRRIGVPGYIVERDEEGSVGIVGIKAQPQAPAPPGEAKPQEAAVAG